MNIPQKIIDCLPYGLLEGLDEVGFARDLARLITECGHAGAAAAALTIADRLDAAKQHLEGARDAMIEQLKG